MRIVVPNPDKKEALLVAEGEEETLLLEGLYNSNIANVRLEYDSEDIARLVFELRRTPRETGKRWDIMELEQVWGKE